MSDTEASKYPYREPFEAKVYHMGVLGPSGDSLRIRYLDSLGSTGSQRSFVKHGA